ncbi:hypothetical protein THIOSC13_760004 [uncultured Thiomicrorhabdus sp.]
MSRPDKKRQHCLAKFYKTPTGEVWKRHFVVRLLNHSDRYAFETCLELISSNTSLKSMGTCSALP